MITRGKTEEERLKLKKEAEKRLRENFPGAVEMLEKYKERINEMTMAAMTSYFREKIEGDDVKLMYWIKSTLTMGMFEGYKLGREEIEKDN